MVDVVVLVEVLEVLVVLEVSTGGAGASAVGGRGMTMSSTYLDRITRCSCNRRESAMSDACEEEEEEVPVRLPNGFMAVMVRPPWSWSEREKSVAIS